MDNDKVFYYICDSRLLEISKNVPNIGNRATIVHSLIASYDLLSYCKVCPCEEATDDSLLSFHSNDYIEYLKKAQLSVDLEKLTDSDEITDFNLGYDCPLFGRIYDFVKLIAGSSLTAAKMLISKTLGKKKKLLPNAIETLRPRSYLRVHNTGKDLKDLDDFNMQGSVSPYDLEFDENNVKVVSDFKFENVKSNNTKYETEISISPTNFQPIAINWFGGWHHAQRDEAGGFCYINDIVIAIQYLLKFCKRILYVDLDIHHGNGVENAFLFSPRVMTFSIHKYEPGFYPATGSLNDVGQGNGKFLSVNVPLRSGITDEKYVTLFKKIFFKIMGKYKPHCIVVQCGADTISGDPLGGFNLTPIGLGECLKLILNEKLPTLILGGGGYNIVNTSKCWTYLMSVVTNHPVSNDIPEHPFLNLYGPDFNLEVTRSLRKDENCDDYMRNLESTIIRNLDKLPDFSYYEN